MDGRPSRVLSLLPWAKLLTMYRGVAWVTCSSEFNACLWLQWGALPKTSDLYPRPLIYIQETKDQKQLPQIHMYFTYKSSSPVDTAPCRHSPLQAQPALKCHLLLCALPDSYWGSPGSGTDNSRHCHEGHEGCDIGQVSKLLWVSSNSWYHGQEAMLWATCWVQTSALSLTSWLILGKFLIVVLPLMAVFANWLFLLFRTIP